MNQANTVDQRRTSLGTLLQRTVAGLIVTTLAVALFRYPFAQFALTLGLLTYAAILYRYPSAWLIVVPALLPVFDLAPWSGWFFFDELDFVVLLTLAMGLWRTDRQSIEARPVPRLLSLAGVLLALSYGVSLMIGLLPLQPLDANAFSNYYSHYNSLRMSKGFFEAVALFLLFMRQRHEESQAAKVLVMGMVLGAAGTVVAVVWERFRFSGLWDFASNFRVTAVFSGLHNGGNDLEAYLVLAQPFIIAWIIFYRRWLTTLTGIALLLLSTYSLFVTFSRAALPAIIVNGFSLVVGLTVSFRHRREYLKPRALLMGSVLATAAFLVVLPILGGRFFIARLEAARGDWDVRVLQSKYAIESMNTDWQATWFGMGLGSYPEIMYRKNPLNRRPASYRFERDKDNNFLRFFPGSPLYYGQWIKVNPNEKYQLSLSVRAKARGAFAVYICEKTFLYSFRCAAQRFEVDPSDSWLERRSEINVGHVGSVISPLGWSFRRPVEFALANSSKEAVIDLDNVQLLDPSGTNVIANGDFSHGSDRWFFTVDDLAPWWNGNHWVQFYFEQGWLGVLAFLSFVTYLFGRLVKQIVDGNWLASIALAALSSFLTVGIFGYLFDTPRMALIYFLIALIFGRGLSAPLEPAEPQSAA
jgi:hypothetical protein